MPTDNALSFAALAPRTVKLALLVSNSTPLTNTLPNASMRPTATVGWLASAGATTLVCEPSPPPPQPTNHRLAAASGIHFCNRMAVSPYFWQCAVPGYVGEPSTLTPFANLSPDGDAAGPESPWPMRQNRAAPRSTHRRTPRGTGAADRRDGPWSPWAEGGSTMPRRVRSLICAQ